MISQLPINFLRLLILLFAQVLIFSNINLSTFVNPYIFPLFILLLPFETPRWVLVTLGFGAGLLLDFFLGSIGMHAAACLALGYFRPNLIHLITPKGTDFEISPNVYAQGVTWFIIYLAISLFFYLLFYFIIEEAGFRNFFFLLLKVLLSTAMSVFFMILFLFLFSSRKQRRFV